MKLNDICEIINGQILNKDFIDFDLSLNLNNISIDSRTVKKGDIFIALKGENHDGHKFIEEVIQKGVQSVIVCDELSQKFEVPIIKVRDTYQTLELLAKHIRNLYSIPLIAITGSVGKTMTKELIYNILSSKYNVLKNEGNKNNHIGLPLTLFKLNDQHEVVVVELGTNNFGEIEKLSNICKPDVAVITNIGTSHIGNFGSQKNIFKEKSKIYEELVNKIIIVNGDDKFLKKIKNFNDNKIYKCGLFKYNDLVVYNINSDFEKTTFNIKIKEREFFINFNIPGIHLINNILIAIKVGLIYGIDIENIIKVIEDFESLDKRMKIEKIDSNLIIEDCYNSSYESLIGVLNVLKNDDREKILIIGDILELGRYSDKIHKRVAKALKKAKNAKILLIGEATKKISKIGLHFDTKEELLNYLNEITIYDSIILLKGSRKFKLEEIKTNFY